MNNKLHKLVDEDVFDQKKSNRRRTREIKELKNQKRGDHESESLEQNYLDKLEKKAKGAINEVERQANRDNEAEVSLGADLENEPVFVEEASKINKKKIRVKKKLVNITAFVISDIKADDNKKRAMGSTDVLAEQAAKETAAAELEAQITDSFTKFIYNKLGNKNKELLLDNYFADNTVSQNEVELMSMDVLSDANYNVVLFSNNGFLMQLANSKEVDDIKNENASFNIINPSGTEIISGLNYEDARTQLKDLSTEYQEDALEFFNKYNYAEENQGSTDVKGSKEVPVSLVKEGDEELFGQDNVDQAKRLEALMADYDSEPAIKNQTPVIPDHIIAEKNKETDDLFNSLFEKDSNNEFKGDGLIKEMMAQEKSEQEDIDEQNKYYETEGAHLGFADKKLKYEAKPLEPVVTTSVENFDHDALVDNKNEKDVLDSPDSVNNENESKDNREEDKVDLFEQLFVPASLKSEVLPYAENMGIKIEQLATHPEFLELNGAQQQFVLEALNRSSLNKIKVEAYNNFKTEEESKRWYNIGFALNKKFHKKKHEVLVAKDIHEKGLEGYGEEELSWLTSIIKNGPEINFDKEGEVESVSYLKTESNTDPKRQELINEYNKRAYYLSLSGTREDFHKGLRADYLTTAREELLASAENDADAAELVNKLVEAEKQLKLHQFLKSDPNNEKIIQSLVDNSLGSWQKFGMMASGQGDKAKYMGIGMASRVVLRSEVATSVLGKAFSYSVGPAVAAAMGAWRSNNRARAGLKEEAELSKLGVENNNKLVKNLNLAVGSKKTEDGKEINIGLADKLENLMDKCNSLTVAVNELEQTKTPDQEDEFQKMKTEQMTLWERLMDRIEYTSQKMEGGLVSFGAPNERAQNYYRLLNSLEEAKTIVFNENYILKYQDRADKTKTSNRVTELTRSNKKIGDISVDQEFKEINKALLSNEITPEEKEKLEAEKKQMIRDWYNLDKLNSLSVSDRLASFLNFNEDKRKSAEFKYLVTETTKGAVMGASFAAVGAWIFEHTGLGHWTSSQLSNLGHFTHVDQATDWVKGVFSGQQSGGAVAEKVATETAIHSSVLNHDIPKVNIETKAPVIENQVPKVETTTPQTHTEQISSEHNSIWRSVKDMFKTNANELGYKGDINDTAALNKWSEIQTANAIDHSEGLTDKVFDGNKVILENDGGVYHVSVEQGGGLAPGHLNSAVEEIAKPSAPEVKVPEEIKVPIVDTPKPIVEVKAPVVESLKPNSEGLSQDPVPREIADKWHLPIDKIQIVDATHIAYFNKEGGVLINTAKGTIDKIATSKMVEIPKEFIDELKGRVPLDRFINRGGLDKIFSNWDKLPANDKTVYSILNLFGQNKLSPFELINKISGTFNVVATDVNINTDNNHFMLGNREFEMNLKGVDKLVKVLSRRFGA